MEAVYENHNFISVCEFLPNHLYFVTVQNINNGGSCDAIIPHTEDVHFFNTDNELIYHNFYGDFGPLGITCLYKFCKKLNNKLATYAGDAFYEKFTNSRFGRKDTAAKLQEKFIKKKVVVYYTSTNNEKRANAAFLIAAYAVLYLGYTPKLAYKALQPTKMRYRAFQDASVGLSPYKIGMKDCLDALHKASVFGFFNFNDFNASECSYYENIEHGDLNWIIPQKFIAFSGPVEERSDYYHHPNFYIEYFLCNNVTDVVRLNQRAYDPKCFTMFNLKHHDLYMQDGTDPPESILKSFMSIAENAYGAIAVHCKAGLGRTGSLIGAYLLKHYRMTAREAIAWIRICRPGSVIGHQQTWLENHEELLWYEGNEWRYKMYGKTEIVPFLHYGIYSFEAPKKEFPGLRELLSNLTKRSRYRFIVKNRSKKSKTRLQQVIKNMLENGKSKKEAKNGSKPEKHHERPAPKEEASYSAHLGQPSGFEPKQESKNVEYLKPPPEMDEELIKQPLNYEYSQHDWKPLPPKDLYANDLYSSANPLPSFHKPVDYFPVHYNFGNAYDGKMQAMYSNPNSFYPTESEYSHCSFEKRPFVPQSLRNAAAKPPEMLKVYPDQAPAGKLEKMKSANLASKSIDKNWKQNSIKYYNSDAAVKKFHSRDAAPPIRTPASEEVCAFDTRVDTISQYSRFNKPYLNKSYLDQAQYNPLIDTNYYSEPKLKSYDYSKQSGRSRGFLLSPEDLQSWVETFDEKVDDTQGDKPYPLKRSSIV